MSHLVKLNVEGLRQFRRAVLDIPPSSLSHSALSKLHNENSALVYRVAVGAMVGGQFANVVIPRCLAGYEDVTDSDALEEVRTRIVEHIDFLIKGLDSSHVVRPILEERILRVKGTKLSTLLKEFNATKDGQPNLA